MAGPQTRRILAALNVATTREAVRLVLGIQERLLRDTPVDTGFARANWVPSIGNPFSEIVGTPQSINTAQQGSGELSVLSWQFDQGPAYISNNVPYILLLNEGTSTQAPAGFVEAAIQAEVAISNRRRLR